MNIKKSLLLIAILSLSGICLADNIIRVSAPVKVVSVTPPAEPTEPEVFTASSCLEKLQRDPGTPSGVYEISVGGKDFPVYCDMTSDGGGWTMVVAQYEPDKLFDWNNGVQTSYDPSLISNKSFTLNHSELPSHTQTAFGKDRSATAFDFFAFNYTTGNIPRQQITSLKTGNKFLIHRDTQYFYSAHNPNLHMGSNTSWNYTLTVYGGSHLNQWSFSPNHYEVNQRGYAFNGLTYGTIDNFAWTVWVR